MEKHLICINIDNTLLNKKGKVSLFSYLIITQLLQKGHYVILTSKNSYQTMLPIIKKFKLYNYPFIALNGGAIYYVNRKIHIIKNISYEFDNKELKSFINTLKEHQSITFYTLKEESTSFKDNCICIKLTTKNNINNLIKKYKNFNFYLLNEEKESFTYLINTKKADKYNALIQIKNKLKVKQENVITFNYDLSDQKIMEAFENSFLMSDSPLENKDIKRTLKPSYKNGLINTLIKKYNKLF